MASNSCISTECSLDCAPSARPDATILDHYVQSKDLLIFIKRPTDVRSVLRIFRFGCPEANRHVYTGQVWWYYDYRRWHVDRKGTKLAMRAMRFVEKQCDAIIQTMKNTLVDHNAPGALRKAILRVENVYNYTGTVACVSKKYGKAGHDLFLDSDFDTKIVTNSHKCVFSNGKLLDTRDTRPPSEQVRDATPEDYQVGIFPFPYVDDFETDPRVEEVFSSIFPNTEIKRFMLYLIALGLDGTPGDKFYAWLYGGGANGKSILTNTIHHLFGDLAGLYSPSSIHGRWDRVRDNGLLNLVGKRVAIRAHGDVSRRLNDDLLKRYTTPGTIAGRHPIAGVYTHSITCKFFHNTNDLPPIKGPDFGNRALAKRLVIIPFETVFVSNPRADRKHECKADDNVHDIIKEERFLQTLMFKFLWPLLHENVEIPSALYEWNRTRGEFLYEFE